MAEARLPNTKRTLLRRGAVLAGLTAALGLAHGPILTGVARFMTVETPVERVDAVLPLYQDPRTIPAAAAGWLQRGYGKHVLVYRPKLGRLERLGLRPAPHEVMRRLLESQGVPPASIVEIGRDITTADELVAAIGDWAGGSHVSTRVLVITSTPGSRLTSWRLHQATNGRSMTLNVDAVPPAEFDERSWWRTRDGVITYFDSYVLWLLSFAR